MGICLDTEHSEGSQAFEEGSGSWTQNSPHYARNAVTPSAGKFPMHNDTHINFESPKVPVIFVLGGPGSGKVTHCDNLMQEKKEIVHINMSDLLQQYAIGNDVPDYGQLSSKTVTEVLMVEMKMAPNAKTLLISGYPRNMRDVVEYSEKIQIINGVILISWRQKILERQIDYGAKLGQVVLSLAKMELKNFYKNVIPVAEYFDQSNMLITINGERPPADVYKDFRTSVFQILGGQENPPEFTNGNAVTVPSNVTSELATMVYNKTMDPLRPEQETISTPPRPKTQVISVGNNTNPISNYSKPKPLRFPPVLWVIGGPGSNKAALCASASRETGWMHISLGRLLRATAESAVGRHNSEANKIKERIGSGELVPFDIVMKFVENEMNNNKESKGIILDGFPRDINQATEFEYKFNQKPTIILLDCSKLQLGKGRLDDSVTAFRRRLEIFRQSTLPMLKTMDSVGRLTIVDGDTDTVPVQEDFKNVVKEHIEYMLSSLQQSQPTAQVENGHVVRTTNGFIPNGNSIQNGHIPNGDATLHDLEEDSVDGVDTTSRNEDNQVSNGVAHKLSNGISSIENGRLSTALNGKDFPKNGAAKFLEDHAKAPHLANIDRNVPLFKSFVNGFANNNYNEVNYMDGHI